MSCYYGIDRINVIGHGEYSPEIMYRGYKFNYWDIEDSLWNWFVEENYDGNKIEAEKSIDKNPIEYEEWISNSKIDIYSMLDDLILVNCFHDIHYIYMLCETDEFNIYAIDDRFFLKDLDTAYFDSIKEIELVTSFHIEDLNEEQISKLDFDFHCIDYYNGYVYYWRWK